MLCTSWGPAMLGLLGLLKTYEAEKDYLRVLQSSLKGFRGCGFEEGVSGSWGLRAIRIC